MENASDPTLERAAQALHEAVAGAATIIIGAEPLPDGDAFGAELALRSMIEGAFGLAATRKEARRGQGPKLVAIINEHGSPERYSFLEDGHVARKPLPEDGEGFDLGIVVDGGIERCGREVRALMERCGARVYVDHHRQGSRLEYAVKLLDPARASTTELLFGVLETPSWKSVALSRRLAEALYLGLLSDTGSFIYSLTTPWTHRVAAKLLEAGVRQTLMGERVILDIPVEDLRLLGRVVDGMTSEHEGRVLVGAMTLEMLGGREPHEVWYDKIVTPIAFVRNTRVTVLFREVSAKTWKLSFRSRGEVDVAALARSLDPNGGGHARAAGCQLEGPLDEVRRRTLAAIARVLP